MFNYAENCNINEMVFMKMATHCTYIFFRLTHSSVTMQLKKSELEIVFFFRSEKIAFYNKAMCVTICVKQHDVRPIFFGDKFNIVLLLFVGNVMCACTKYNWIWIRVEIAWFVSPVSNKIEKCKTLIGKRNELERKRKKNANKSRIDTI